MTYQEAQILSLPERDNPRFIACWAALNKEPDMFEFTFWTQEKWREFANKLNGTGYRDCVMALGFERAHKEFNVFIGVPNEN